MNSVLFIFLFINIQKFDFDADSDVLRVLGINVKENEYIALNAHQSVDIKGPMKLTLIKQHFDSIHVKKLNEAASDS